MHLYILQHFHQQQQQLRMTESIYQENPSYVDGHICLQKSMGAIFYSRTHEVVPALVRFLLLKLDGNGALVVAFTVQNSIESLPMVLIL